ncbi:hypothetical protein F383_25370 [Gossypium arboreum]|uniref:Uncharacterized protein n=1 Tax=Gossypium arboreum TaxID=29729 RepID=A0A0B0P2B3_GOSAR|nr:hypothetical protein F383_25370 [Gossypium arboreum]
MVISSVRGKTVIFPLRGILVIQLTLGHSSVI